MTRSDLSRFWAKVRVDRATGCWIWTAAVRTWRAEPWDGGYPAFHYRGRMVRGHIFAFRILFGHWPKDGIVLLHGCDNRRCVNVLEHVKPGTQAQNVKDMLAKGRATHQRKKATIQREGHHGETQGRSADESRPGPDGPVPVGPAGA